MPSSALVSYRYCDFTDSACTVPLPTVDRGASELQVAVAVHDPGADCPELAGRLRRIVGLHDGPVFSRTADLSCTPAPVGDGVGHCEVDDTVDPSAVFPLVTAQDL